MNVSDTTFNILYCIIYIAGISDFGEYDTVPDMAKLHRMRGTEDTTDSHIANAPAAASQSLKLIPAGLQESALPKLKERKEDNIAGKNIEDEGETNIDLKSRGNQIKWQICVTFGIISSCFVIMHA